MAKQLTITESPNESLYSFAKRVLNQAVLNRLPVTFTKGIYTHTVNPDDTIEETTLELKKVQVQYKIHTLENA